MIFSFGVKLLGGIVAVVLIPFFVFAQSPLLLKDSLSKEALTQHLEILADPSGQWSLQDVMTPSIAQQFKTIQNPNLGPTDVIYWARLTLRNSSTKDSIGFLQYPNNHLDEITFFRPSEDERTYRESRVGNIYPLANRDVRHPMFTFRVKVPAQQESTFYLRFNSYGKVLTMSWFLWSEQAFLNHGTDSHTFWFAYLGVFSIATGYVFFLFLLFRNPNYLYYTLGTFFNLLGIICQTGLDDLLLWENPGQKGHYGITLSILMNGIFLLLFTRSFLKLSEYLPRWDKLFKGAIGLFLIWLLTFWWVPRPLHVPLVTAFQIPVMLLILGSSFSRYRQGYKSSIFLIGVSFSMFVMNLFIVMIIFGGVGEKLWIDLSIATGRLAEAILLLMALASAYRTVLKEKVNAQIENAQLKETMVEELRRMDGLKDEFLANTSHELKTPLHGIIGLCETMLQQAEAPLSQKQSENLSLITNSAQRLSSLVGDILDFSKIKNHDLQLQLRKTELQSTIRVAEQLCAPLMGSKALRLSTDMPENSVWVHADENRLQQILINLLSNAIKFTHEGEIVMGIQFEGNQAIVSVKDMGIGIDEAHREQIFRPFFQADGTISREYGGTGLGLAVTRHLVQLHQGELHVKSVLGEGSTFSFTLPLIQGQANSPLETSESGQQVFPSRSSEDALLFDKKIDEGIKNTSQTPMILVVDDEPLNTKVLQDYLSNTGYDVVTASDGFQALECLKDRAPSLILLDVMMPRLNGYEVCRQVRQLYNGAQLPIIMQSAKSQIDDHIQGLQVGANDYLTKPFHHEEMLARVRNQLELKNAVAMVQENQRLQWEIERAQQIEANLRLSERRLSELLNVGNEALLAIDEEGKIIYCNQLLEAWLTQSADTLLGQSVNELIPPHSASHPLQFQWSDIQQSSPSLHYPYVSLKNGKGDTWEGQMWQTLLELEDPVYVLTLAHLSSEVSTDTPIVSPQWLEELNHNRARLQQMTDILTDLHPSKLKSQPHLLKELEAIDEALSKLATFKPTQNPEERFRQALVEVMNQSIDCWETSTQSTAIELAEKSGLWKVYTEENRVRVRVLERYLEPKRLPKNPRWKNVVRTANFVLSHCSLPFEQKSRLEAPLNRLLQLVHQRNLSSTH